MFFRETCLEKSLTGRKKICIDRNGIEEENFEKWRICIGKTERNSFKIETFKVCQIYYGLLNDIIQNVSKSKLIMVLIQVSKIPTLFAF